MRMTPRTRQQSGSRLPYKHDAGTSSLHDAAAAEKDGRLFDALTLYRTARYRLSESDSEHAPAKLARAEAAIDRLRPLVAAAVAAGNAAPAMVKCECGAELSRDKGMFIALADIDGSRVAPNDPSAVVALMCCPAREQHRDHRYFAVAIGGSR
jgi:hypothetical protein